MMNTRPVYKDTIRMVMLLDARGVTFYCNADGIEALVDEMQWIHSSDPSEHFETHIRWQFDDHVRLIISKELEELFSKLPEDAPDDANPSGFEMTIMQVTDEEISKIKGGRRKLTRAP